MSNALREHIDRLSERIRNGASSEDVTEARRELDHLQTQIADIQQAESPKNPLLTPETIARCNLRARFLPVVDREGVPVLNVGGAAVGVWLDSQGALQIAVDLDEVDPAVFSGEAVPMKVTVQGNCVYLGI